MMGTFCVTTEGGHGRGRSGTGLPDANIWLS